MAKNKAPTEEQKRVLKRWGLNPLMWVIQQDLPNSMIVRHRVTGEFKVLEK